MIKSIAKKGRPQAFHRASWGERIDGLSRLADGRWKVAGKPVVKFTEPDERLAVARFRKMEAERSASKKSLLPMASVVDGHAAGKKMVAALKGNAFVVRIPRDGGPVRMARSFDTTEVWAWLREQILTKPQQVAQRLGIEQIGYLTEIQRPTDSPKLKALGDLYGTKDDITPNEASRSKLFWQQFSRAVGVETVRELTHDRIAAYEKVVRGASLKPKSIKHRYGKVRTILSYAIKRGLGVEDCRRALDIASMLQVKGANPLDPRPIDTRDFWAIHAEAVKAGDDVFATLLLTALNCAMYGGEVSALKWDEINMKTGELVTRRPKTKVSRVAVLWPRTLDAIKKLEQHGDWLFYSKRSRHKTNSVLKLWGIYRRAAKIDESVTFGQIRDAAFTIACQFSNLDQARVLAGHRLPGQSDNYIRRRPQFVAEACKAIRAEFDA